MLKLYVANELTHWNCRLLRLCENLVWWLYKTRNRQQLARIAYRSLAPDETCASHIWAFRADSSAWRDTTISELYIAYRESGNPTFDIIRRAGSSDMNFQLNMGRINSRGLDFEIVSWPTSSMAAVYIHHLGAQSKTVIEQQVDTQAMGEQVWKSNKDILSSQEIA
jgi:hypothetical protein